jgi:hypothetical protein
MSRDRQRLADYLTHILEAIARIDHYTEGMDEGTFLSDQLVQDAVIRNIEIIGEASNNIRKRYPEFAASHPDLPLSFAYEIGTPWPTATSRRTSKSFGIRSRATFQVFTPKLRA